MSSYWDQLDMKSMSGSPSQRDCRPSMAEPTHIDSNPIFCGVLYSGGSFHG